MIGSGRTRASPATCSPTTSSSSATPSPSRRFDRRHQRQRRHRHRGGTISIFDAGSFNYISNAGFTGTDSFTYTIRDDGLDGIAGNADDLVSIGTVTITVTGQVWYVDSAGAGGGDGTSANPFGIVTARGRRQSRRQRLCLRAGRRQRRASRSTAASS